MGSKIRSRTTMTTSHLINLTNASTRLRSTRDKAFQESSQHIAHTERPACESFAARQTAVRSSSVDDTAVCGVSLGSCFFDCDGGERSVRFHTAEVLHRVCRNHKHCHRSDSAAPPGQSCER